MYKTILLVGFIIPIICKGQLNIKFDSLNKNCNYTTDTIFYNSGAIYIINEKLNELFHGLEYTYYETGKYLSIINYQFGKKMVHG
jgi:antitoxin component YwqK of YwqJK toxin-antitoxin module